MSMSATMTALATAVATTSIDRVYDWPTESVSPPCAIIGYPELEFDFTYTEVRHIGTYPVWVVVGLASARSAGDTLSTYLAEVPPVLNGNLGGAVDSASCTRGRLADMEIAGVSYLVVQFTVEVIE